LEGTEEFGGLFMNNLEAMIVSRCRKSQTPRQMYKLLSMNYSSKRSYNYICSIMSRLASEKRLTKTRMGKNVYYRANDKALRGALNFIWKPIDDRVIDHELTSKGLRRLSCFTNNKVKDQRKMKPKVGISVVVEK